MSQCASTDSGFGRDEKSVASVEKLTQEEEEECEFDRLNLVYKEPKQAAVEERPDGPPPQSSSNAVALGDGADDAPRSDLLKVMTRAQYNLSEMAYACCQLQNTQADMRIDQRHHEDCIFTRMSRSEAHTSEKFKDLQKKSEQQDESIN